MRLDRDRVTAGVRTGGNAKYEDRAPKLIETLNLLPSSDDVLEDGLGFPAVRVPHATEIRNPKYAHDIAFADSLAVDVLDARGLRGGHGT
jgi:hypothetical protein